MIDPQPSPTAKPAPSERAPSAEPDLPAPEARPLIVLDADGALACVDELCLPAEATR